MFRMLPPARLALLVFLPIFCTSCKTIYTDVYRHKRNYFVADKPKEKTSAQEKKALEEVAKAQATTTTTTVGAGAATPTIPGMEPAPALPDAGMTTPAAPAAGAAPAVPGL